MDTLETRLLAAEPVFILQSLTFGVFFFLLESFTVRIPFFGLFEQSVETRPCFTILFAE